MYSLAVCLLIALLTSVAFSAAPPTTMPADVTRDVVYGTAAGVKLKLDVSVPQTPGPHPAVILVHGGAWQAGDKTHFRTLFDPLTRAGYAWFSVNYRLAPKFTLPAGADDVAAAVAWVHANAAKYNVDPARVALLGESAGGHLVELVATKMDADSPARPAAVVALYAPSDLTSLAESTRARGLAIGPLLKALFGRTEWDADAVAALKAASPITYVKAGLPPFLLMHGTADQLVPIAQSTAFEAALKAAGVPVEMVTVPNGPHGMIFWNMVAPQYREKILSFLDDRLKAK